MRALIIVFSGRIKGEEKMHVFIVYAHPSDDSFTKVARDEFIKGLESAGHTYEVSDLYKMRFNSEMSA